ncbi:MAG: DUF488 domain-containing protein [Acidobacteriota bacterium]
MTRTVWTIGHSSHKLDAFLALLDRHEIRCIADVRREPRSQRHPQFSRGRLELALEAHGIAYRFLGEELGGKLAPAVPREQSPNGALGSAPLRAYADRLVDPPARSGVRRLLAMAARMRTAMMCAEACYTDCHRQILADLLVAKGAEVVHIQPSGEIIAHVLSPRAVARDGRVTYPARAPEQPGLFD